MARATGGRVETAKPYFHVERKKRNTKRSEKKEEDDEEKKEGEAYITADAGIAIRLLYLILLLERLWME